MNNHGPGPEVPPTMHKTLPIHRPTAPADTRRRRSTLRLGLLVSLIAAVVAVLVEAVAHLPAVLILVPVVVVGFVVSWHASDPSHR